MINFPPNPVDGQKVIDTSGQLYVYDGESNAWLEAAYEENLVAVVSENNDGIITPAIVSLLKEVPSASAGLKILPNTSAYYYLLMSRNNSILLNINNNTISIDANSGAVIRALHDYACPGLAGDVGDSGDAGENSLYPGPIETTKTPIYASDSIIIDAVVEVPLSTAISTRIYSDSGLLLATVIYNLDGSSYIAYNIVNAEIVDAEYTITDNSLHLEIKGDWPDDVLYKSRQIGPSGNDGEDGSPFVIIRDNLIDDPEAVAESAISTMRANRRNGILFSRATMLSTAFAAASLTGQNGNFITIPEIVATLNSQTPSLWAAVEPTVDSNKSILRWGFSGCLDAVLGLPTSCSIPSLSMPSWNPHPVCYRDMSNGQDFDGTTTYDISCFKWWESDSATPPFDLIFPDTPTVACCQEDCFYCNQEVDNCDGAAPRPLIG